MKMNPRLSLALTAAAFTALPISVGHAQDDSSATPLEEIIVAARKRDESLQEVPIAVDVISAVRLDQLSIDSVENVARYTSGLTYDQGVLPIDTASRRRHR